MVKLNRHQKDILLHADKTDLWGVLRLVIEDDLESLRYDMRHHPKFSDEDLTEDLRHKMGGADRLQWVLSLPEAETDHD